MKKKVAILTMDKVNNFGTLLQMYALYSKVNEMGYDCNVINYVRDSNKSLSLKNKIEEPIKSFIRNIVTKNSLNERELKYTEFRNKFSFTKDVTHSTIAALSNKFDAFICGSDQIWNPEFTGLDANNYLAFAPKHKRLSYAASIGLDIDLLNSNETEVLSSYIREIPFVSVREEQANNWINKSLRHKSKWVLDPTLLLNPNEWSLIAEKERIEKSPYILVYELARKPHSHLSDIARKIANKEQLKVINILPTIKDLKKDNETNLFNLGPCDFINLIKNAEWLITNSYHGLLFAIQYNIPFWCVTNSYSTRPISSKLSSILKTFSLSQRILSEMENERELFIKPDFEKANSRLPQLKEDSLRWLSESLDHVTNFNK